MFHGMLAPREAVCFDVQYESLQLEVKMIHLVGAWWLVNEASNIGYASHRVGISNKKDSRETDMQCCRLISGHVGSNVNDTNRICVQRAD